VTLYSIFIQSSFNLRFPRILPKGDSWLVGLRPVPDLFGFPIARWLRYGYMPAYDLNLLLRGGSDRRAKDNRALRFHARAGRRDARAIQPLEEN
jgi:hypothetical protein